MKHLMAIILLFICGLIHAEVYLELEAKKVSLGDTFRITITMKDTQGSSVPDLSPLQDNFQIIGTERSSNYSIINGKATNVDQWTVYLTPLRVGIFRIPALNVGSEQTKPTLIEVSATKNTKNTTTDNQTAQPPQDVKMTATVDNKTPYLNQQIIYTVKLFNSVQLVDTEVLPPQAENALIVPLGEGKHYQSTENGRFYAVVEQQYALFPQKTGEITLYSPQFKALVFDTMPQRIKVKAEAVKLQVTAAIPQKNNPAWLPAIDVTLEESYDKLNSHLQQGDVLTRVINLRAVGMPGELIPAIKLANTDDYSIYSEKPVARNAYESPNLVGNTSTKFTYLFNKAGKITLPELKIAWFNTQTKKTEYASLPAKTLIITGAVTDTKSTPFETTPKDIKGITNNNQSISTTSTIEKAPLLNLLIAFLALGWISTLLFWWWRVRKPKNFYSKKQIFQQLEQACASNDPKLIKEAVILWASWQWPEKSNLSLIEIGQLAADPRLKQEINALSKVLYQQQISTYCGDKLYLAIKNHRLIKIKKPRKKDDLPPINPSLP